jgi:hypothetical protein
MELQLAEVSSEAAARQAAAAEAQASLAALQQRLAMAEAEAAAQRAAASELSKRNAALSSQLQVRAVPLPRVATSPAHDASFPARQHPWGVWQRQPAAQNCRAPGCMARTRGRSRQAPSRSSLSPSHRHAPFPTPSRPSTALQPPRALPNRPASSVGRARLGTALSRCPLRTRVTWLATPTPSQEAKRVAVAAATAANGGPVAGVGPNKASAPSGLAVPGDKPSSSAGVAADSGASSPHTPLGWDASTGFSSPASSVSSGISPLGVVAQGSGSSSGASEGAPSSSAGAGSRDLRRSASSPSGPGALAPQQPQSSSQTTSSGGAPAPALLSGGLGGEDAYLAGTGPPPLSPLASAAGLSGAGVALLARQKKLISSLRAQLQQKDSAYAFLANEHSELEGQLKEVEAAKREYAARYAFMVLDQDLDGHIRVDQVRLADRWTAVQIDGRGCLVAVLRAERQAVGAAGRAACARRGR